MLLSPNDSTCQALVDQEHKTLEKIGDGIMRRGPDDFSSTRITVCGVNMMECVIFVNVRKEMSVSVDCRFHKAKDLWCS